VGRLRHGASNLTFERGQTLRFGDRTHHHISGTASIDAAGNVLFPNDVVRQVDRALDNVAALLESKGAALKDMAYFVVYMRNPGEIMKIRERMYARISRNFPILFVEESVCRPAWLVEIEGVAIKADKQAYPDFI
jgi:enamine deaminase RidA (YjgF/YER057c/UK114 family)